jgi:hypothetical protein
MGMRIVTLKNPKVNVQLSLTFSLSRRERVYGQIARGSTRNSMLPKSYIPNSAPR